MSGWLQQQSTKLLERVTDRRGFLARSTLVGAAIATNPIQYVLKPQSAYAATCNCRGSSCACGSMCCDGYTEFCCTIIGTNTCPSGTIAGGWWKADGSNFCGGPRYYIDCNVAPGYNPCSCGCANGDCNNRAACCTQFRYGQCHQEVPVVGAIMCRVVTCTAPWIFDPTCTTAALTDNKTGSHDAACLHVAPPVASPRSSGRLSSAGWFLADTLMASAASHSFVYGTSGDIPIVGDWNGDGHDSIGVFRNGIWYLRNTLTSGVADIILSFGNPGDIPVVGDWDGDGIDGIGVVRNGVWYLRNTLTSGIAETTLSYGNPGDHPIVGRWQAGATHDGVGIVRNGMWYLRNQLTSGNADLNFAFGNPGDIAIVGDWSGGGIDTPGIVRDWTWFLRSTNTSGLADIKTTFGDRTDIPLVGRFGPGLASVPGVAR